MNIVSELHQDHVNLSKLLSLLDKKIIAMQAGEHPNFSLIADVINYIANYAEVYHHPREDKMYAFFAGRQSDLDEVMHTCEEAHVALKGTGRSLLEVIDEILNDAVIPMTVFIDKLALFVNNEKAHLDFEETKIFPVLNTIASEDDWQALAKRLPTVEDPLFGEKCAEEYVELYKALTEDLS